MDLFADAPLTLPDADLRYLPHWLDAPLASAWLLRLEQETPWEQPILRIHGEEHPTPRLVAWYGDPEAAYRYSGQVHRPLPWTALLGEIRERVEREIGQRVNGVLLNYYRDGQDSMGWHSDDEPELRRDPLVASLSLGGSRRFDLRRKARPASPFPGTDPWQPAGHARRNPASLATSGGEDPPLLHAPFEPDLPPGVSPAMNDDDKVIDLSAERDKRIHDVHEKRLQEVRKAFEQVLPLGKPRKKPKGKPKKR
ncbi:putative alkylated DNA repair protein [Pseudomonas aeruginosa]|nr:putative alkylated DNA repair protein [Pseudomonas aeruginosa]